MPQRPLPCTVMDNSEYQRLREEYKTSVDAWIAAIREEESLATPDHSMIAMEKWDAAPLSEQNAQKKKPSQLRKP